MKWRVDPIVFEEKVQNWIHCIENDNSLPPIIIGYADGKFEINCNSPLFEALIRLKKKEFELSSGLPKERITMIFV